MERLLLPLELNFICLFVFAALRNEKCALVEGFVVYRDEEVRLSA